MEQNGGVSSRRSKRKAKRASKKTSNKRVDKPEQIERNRQAAKRTKKRHAKRESDFVESFAEMKEFVALYVNDNPGAEERTRTLRELLDEGQEVADTFIKRQERRAKRKANKIMREASRLQ